jgi:predicted MFS family arabinose efflux permease
VPPSGVPAALAALYGWRLVLGDGWSRRVLVGALAEGALMFGVLAFVPSWLHERTGMSLAAAGAAVGAVGVGGLLYATSARRFIARLGERGLLAAGGATVCAGFVVLAAFARGPADATTWLVALAGCGLAGFGFYMLHNTMQTLATQLAPQARATAVGLFAVAIFAGQSIGVATVARIGPTLGFATTFVACGAALAALGIALGAMVSRRAGRVGR